MRAFVNVLEEIIVREVYTQIEELRPEVQPKVKVAEVTAYALNRLPPLFATSITGWKYQYDYALNKLHPQITQIVKYGIHAVLLGDPLHDITPLPNHLFLNNAGVLHQLGQLLNRKYLRWRDVPILIEEIIGKSSCLTKIDDQTIIQANDETQIQSVSHLNHSHRALLSGSKRFMEKQLAKKKEALRLENEHIYANSYAQPDGNSWADEKRSRDAVGMEYRALQSYTLQSQLGLINVLEHLIFLAIEKFSTPEIYAELNLGEVAAYALNHLPPMYSTSVRGFRHLRQKALTEFSRELIGAVRTGIMKVVQISQSNLQPIYAYQFMQEYEQAILLLRTLLNRDDIELHNILAIVQDLMECRKVA